jgi:hypothetical protein
MITTEAASSLLNPTLTDPLDIAAHPRLARAEVVSPTPFEASVPTSRLLKDSAIPPVVAAASTPDPLPAKTQPSALPIMQQDQNMGITIANTMTPWMPVSLMPKREYGKALKQLSQHLSQLDEEAVHSAQETTPGALSSHRYAFVASGGHSLMDAWAQISSPDKLIRYLPRALAIGFLAPLPWQWFDTSGSTGIMRALAGFEMLVIYFLLPSILMGSWKMLRSHRIDELFLITYVWLMTIMLSLVVANLGTLFRLRLQCLLPLLIVAVAGRPLEFYRRMTTLVLEACQTRFTSLRTRRYGRTI